MTAAWQEKQLGAVSAITYGYTQSASNEAVGPRFLRITDIQDDGVNWDRVPFCQIDTSEVPRYRLADGDIVFARTGATTGKSFLVTKPPDAVFASYLIRLRLLEKTLLPEFVCRFFQTDRYWKAIMSGSTGSAQGGFNATKLGALEIPVPPLTEQQRIVRILDEAFESIAQAKANTEKNLQNARALFDNHLESVFGAPDLTHKPVAQIAKHSLGKMLDKSKNKGAPEPYLRNLNVRWFVFDLSDVLKMRFQPDELERYSVRQGDVVVCEGGYPGRAAIWAEQNPIFFQKALHRVRFHDRRHSKWFVYYLYSQEKCGGLRRNFSGTGIQHFTGEALAAFNVPLPPETKLEGLIAGIEEIQRESHRLESIYKQKLGLLVTLEKSLLNQAFTGNL